ncbi:hypothetical protein GCM10027268_10640 [Brachybacterium huguangmaarense]
MPGFGCSVIGCRGGEAPPGRASAALPAVLSGARSGPWPGKDDEPPTRVCGSGVRRLPEPVAQRKVRNEGLPQMVRSETEPFELPASITVLPPA